MYPNRGRQVGICTSKQSRHMLLEVQNYLQQLDNLRRLVLDLIQDLPAEALNWRLVEGSADHATNSLAVLAAHVAGAEHFWIAEVIGGFPLPVTGTGSLPCRLTTKDMVAKRHSGFLDPLRAAQDAKEKS